MRWVGRRGRPLGSFLVAFGLLALSVLGTGWPVLAAAHVVPGDPQACQLCHGGQGAVVASKVKDNRLCYSCHTDARGPVFHRVLFEQGAHGPLWREKSRTPFARGTQASDRRGLCVNCHDPHESSPGRSSTWLGTATDSTALCASCHVDAQAYGAWPGPRVYAESPHANPVTGVSRSKSGLATGECLNCHDPHNTGNQKLLTGPRTNDFCLGSGCHNDADLGSLWPGKNAYQLAGGVHANPPSVAKPGVRRTYPGRDETPGSCTNCHDPHGALDPRTGRLTPGLTNAAGTELCYQCHSNLRFAFAGFSRHRVDEPGTNLTCATCHNPHIVGRLGGTVSDPSRPDRTMTADDAFCLRCHDGSFGLAANIRQEIASPAALGSFFGGEQNRNLHFAHVTERRTKCLDCHDPHGSNNRALLRTGITLGPSYPNKSGCSGGLAGQLCH